MHCNAVAFAALLASLPVAVFAQKGAKADRGADRTDSIDYVEMRRDLETMRRILERQAFESRAGGKREDKDNKDKPSTDGQAQGRGVSGSNDDTAVSLLSYAYSTDSHGAYSLWSGNSEAYYVPGDGALFLMRTSTVLTPPPAETAEKDESKESSLWDEVRNEVDGRYRGTVRTFLRRGPAPYDAATVDALKTRLLTALGKYGSKIGQLGDSQHLTIVMRGSSGGPALNLAGRVTGAQGQAVDRALVSIAGSPDSLYAADAAASVLTIRVSRADVAAYAAGSLDLDTFKQRAKITQY